MTGNAARTVMSKPDRRIPLSRNGRAFQRDDHASVGVIFALSLTPVVLLIGAVFDYGRALQARDTLRQATDSAALALTKVATSQTSAQLEALAANMLATASTRAPSTLVGAPQISEDKMKVCLDTTTNVDTTFMKIVAIDHVRISANACATNASVNFEIALVLDTSGSMNNSAGSMTKIAAVRSVANSFVNTMYSTYPTPTGQTTPRVKFSVVPFSDSVAVNDADTGNRSASWIDVNAQSSWHWKGWSPSGAASGLATGVTATSRFTVYSWLKSARASYDWAGCFETPPYPLNVQEFTPSSANPDSLFVPMLAPDEPDTMSGGYSNNYLSDNPTASCTGAAPTTEAGKQGRVCKYKTPSITASTSSGNGPNYSCVSKPLQRLTATQLDVTNKISSLTASGATNLHEGLMWGWRTIAPSGPFGDGVSYASSSASVPTRKVLILMTDGMNTWGAKSNALNKSDYEGPGYYTSSTTGSSRFPTTDSSGNTLLPITTSAGGTLALDQLTREACANARAAGIEVYTVGFESSDAISAQGKTLLKQCAGDDTHFFLATSATGLSDAFSAIGKKLNALYLSK